MEGSRVKLSAFLLAVLSSNVLAVLVWCSAAAQCIDYRDPYAQYYVTEVSVGGVYSGTLSGHYYYLAEWTSGVSLCDVSDPRTPRFISRIETETAAEFVEVEGTYAYVSCGQSTLQIYDVSYPALPRLVATLPLRALGVDAVGPLVYVAAVSELKIVDVSDPASPHVVGSVEAPGNQATKVAVVGSYAYVTAWNAGLLVFDVSDPTSPALIGRVVTPGDAYDVKVVDGYAYVADRGSGLTVIDVSNPTAPTVVGNADTPGTAIGVSVSDGTAYVADSNSNMLMVIDVTTPTAPRVMGTADARGFPYDAAVAGEYVLVAEYGHWLLVVKAQCAIRPGACCRIDGTCTVVTEPECSLPSVWQGGGTSCSPGPCQSGACCFIAACEVYTSDECAAHGGSWQGSGTACDPDPCFTSDVREERIPEVTRVLGASPNPASTGTRISYDLAAATDVHLSIFDVSGRVVRHLVNRRMTPGRLSTQWDRLDDSGHAVSSGMYYARLSTDGSRSAVAVVLLH